MEIFNSTLLLNLAMAALLSQVHRRYIDLEILNISTSVHSNMSFETAISVTTVTGNKFFRV